MASYQLDVTTANATLTGISVTTAGTYTASDIATNGFKFWINSSNNLTGATQLGTSQPAVGNGGTVAVTGLSQTIASGTTRYILVTADIASGATVSNTIGIAATAFANITFASGNKTGADPLAPSNAMTIVACTPTNVTGLSLTPGNGQITVSWTNPGCLDDVVIAVHSAPISASPSGVPTINSNSYTDGANPTLTGGAVLVYRGASSPQIITNLTNGTTYYVKVFTRKGTVYSAGVELSATPALPNATTILWNSATGSAWLTGTNWTGSAYPALDQVAQFGSNPTGTSGVGINFNSTTNAGTQVNGQKIQEVGAVEITSSRSSAMLIGNSSTTTGATGKFRLNGVVVNSISDVVIRNNSSQNLTIQNTQGSGTQTMTVILNNSTDNKILIDGSGGVIISSEIEAASGPVTIQGSGTGIVEFAGQNNYTTTTNVNGSTLRLNRSGGGTLPAGNSITINGGTLRVSTNQTLANLTLTSGMLQVDAGVTLTITGNASFNGTIQNNGRIVLGGTAQQTLTFGGSVNYAAMNELEVNNSSSNGVVVSGGNLRTAQMLFTNGRINLGGNDLIITSNTPGAVSEGNTGSYAFNGRIRRGVAAVGTYHLPLGGAAATDPTTVLYQPARIEITTATNPVDLFASFVGTDPLSPGTLPPNTLVNGTSLTGVLNAGYWRINADGGTFDGAYTITVQLRGATNLVGNANRYAVIKRADETEGWQSVGTHNNATQSESGGVVTAARSALTGFSDFTIAFSTATLPVTFTRFTAQLQTGGALLEWTAAESSSLSHYEAERSLNGSTFTGFARRLPQAGAAAHSYQVRDAQVPAGTVYYRIAAVSQSGEKRYSPVIALQTTTARNQLRVLPQAGGRSLVLQLNGFERGQYQLTIIGADGRRVLNQTLVHDGGNSTRMVQLNESLPKGIYHILLQNGQLQLRETILF
ncbi:MAG: beta strand repeat-containing protein [Lacibacter sp.]